MQQYIPLEELQNLIISNNGKRIVQLKDIAEVKIKEGVEYTKINANGREGLLVAVIKQPNTNLIDAFQMTWKKKWRSLKKVLPQGVTSVPIMCRQIL